MDNVNDPAAAEAVAAVRDGRVGELERLLVANPGLATAHLTDDACPGEGRTLLHVLTDWPGHRPEGARTAAALVAAGADVDAPFVGRHAETPLHWAASSDDVAVLDALLDLGARIDAPGGVIPPGTPLADAVAFAQWNAARRLVERGAPAGLGEAAALGLVDELDRHLAGDVRREEIHRAFWMACHGGQHGVAEGLLERGADPGWLPHWERATALDAAVRNGFADLAAWLRERGGRPAPDPPESAPTDASGGETK